MKGWNKFNKLYKCTCSGIKKLVAETEDENALFDSEKRLLVRVMGVFEKIRVWEFGIALSFECQKWFAII